MTNQQPLSSDGTPATPTPQKLPTAISILTGAGAAWATNWLAKQGFDQQTSLLVAGAAASVVTSIAHNVAQRIHWSTGK